MDSSVIPGLAPDAVASRLRACGIVPTRQRLEIAQVLFHRMEHLSADQILARLKANGLRASKATVYNTLRVFLEKALVRELIVDPSRVFYDPNMAPHHHFYDVVTGELTDIPAESVQIATLPPLPAGSEPDGVEVIIRTRPRAGLHPDD
jgi:Fur family iron response transcriptional regulator